MARCMPKPFRLWIPNGWAEWDGRTFVRCAGRAERRWYLFQTNRLHVACATCDRAGPCKNVVAKSAGQTNGRIRLKLGGLIAIMSGLTLFG